MKAQMIVDEAGNEVITVVIARMAAQRQRLARLLAGGLKPMRVQLIGQEFVGQPLVDEDAAGLRCRRLP